MKLEGLRILQKVLSESFHDMGIEASVYYFFNDAWHDLATESKCDHTHVAALDNARQDPVAYHAPKSLDAWYFLEKDECAVRLIFSQSPKLPKRRSLRATLEKEQEVATNEYKVTHNPLTHLLARDEFKRRLAKEIELLKKLVPNKPQVSTSPRMLAVFAFDIDHFKQVNDTWGHLYGDQVLKIFARRLEECAEKIKSDASTPIVQLGHPSGEEFLVFLSANVKKDQFIDWANEFRKMIGDKILPTDDDWIWLSSIDNISNLTPPPLHRRTITASVGVVLYNPVVAKESTSEAISTLLEKADTALYRAKAAGRDQVIAYDEILNSCGRVLEYDSLNGVVAVDIGSNVGVTIGQEFKVFSPTFSGRKEFTINDGRTKRTLGMYPRVQAARVVIFDAQPEISFAFKADADNSASELEPLSHLEAIPAGSIGHLLPTSSKYIPSTFRSNPVSAIAEVHIFLKKNADENKKVFTVVFRLTRESEYLKKYGSVALNAALAMLYREVRSFFRDADYVELIDRGSVCAVGSEAFYNENNLVAFIDKIRLELPDLDLFAGIFFETGQEFLENDGQENLKSENALEFARYAAADAGRELDAHHRYFSYTTITSILLSIWNSRSYDVLEADFNKLLDLGLRSGIMYNFGGLAAWSRGKYQDALNYFAEAMNCSPGNLTYIGSFANTAYQLGEIEVGLKVLNELSKEQVHELKDSYFFAFENYALLLAKAKIAGLPSYIDDRFNYVASIIVSLPEQKMSYSLIHQALNTAPLNTAK